MGGGLNPVGSPQSLLSYRQLGYLALANLGLQAAGTFELNNASGLFKFLGASDPQLGWLWLIPPLAGLIVQPVLGQASDLLDTRYGKRMPYIYAGAVLSCLSMVVMSLSEALWLTTAMMLCMSCSINCSTEGLRSLIGDITPNRQKSQAFAWQAVFGSLGAMLAGAIPWLLNSTQVFVNPSDAPFKIPVVLKVSLILGALMLFQTVSSMRREIRHKDRVRVGVSGARVSLRAFCTTLGRALYGNLRQTPPVIRRLFLVQMLTWAGFFCVWIYFGLALAQRIYGLPPGADVSANPAHQAMLTNGVIQSGICFALYQFVGVLYTLALPTLAERFDPNRVHAMSLLAGAATLLAMPFLHDMRGVYVAMIGLGLFSGSLGALPYAIVSSEVPRANMGASLGIFNITITVPQILFGLVIGPISRTLFGNQAIHVIALAGVLLAMAGLLLLRQQGLRVLPGLRACLARRLLNPASKAPSPGDPARGSRAARWPRWIRARGPRGWLRRIRDPAIRCRSSKRPPC
jgi:maltose/moltooligosaccharide transporter